MNLKKIKIISIFGTFSLAFLTHFLYDWFPNAVFAIFFPVNESIWEHMKMLYTTILLYELIEFFILKVNNIRINNFIFATFIAAFISIPIYLIIFLPIYYKIGENMFISISIMLLTIIIVQIIHYKTIKAKDLHLNILSFILIILIYLVMGILTYYPPKYNLFFDSQNELYGINIYTKK